LIIIFLASHWLFGLSLLFSFGLALALVFVLIPVDVMASAVHVVLREAKHFESGNEELKFRLDVTLELDVVDLMLKEVFTVGLPQFEVIQPLAKVLTLHVFFRVDLFLFFDLSSFLARRVSFLFFKLFPLFCLSFMKVGDLRGDFIK
jgi:hypothetical protein